MTEKKLENIKSQHEIYDKLAKRQENIMQNIEERIDIMAKFTKDESSAYIRRKKEGIDPYESQIIRYIKDAHVKKSYNEVRVNNNQYLLYADRYISTLLKSK